MGGCGKAPGEAREGGERGGHNGLLGNDPLVQICSVMQWKAAQGPAHGRPRPLEGGGGKCRGGWGLGRAHGHLLAIT